MTATQKKFGKYFRSMRVGKFTVRGLAKKLGIQPSYVSKVERGEVSPPAPATIIRWATVIGVDTDTALALAGKVAPDILALLITSQLAAHKRAGGSGPVRALPWMVRRLRLPPPWKIKS